MTELVVIHGISLPPGQYGGPEIEALFTNTLDPDAHPYFADISGLEVSAHFLVRRTGEVVHRLAASTKASTIRNIRQWCNHMGQKQLHAVQELGL